MNAEAKIDLVFFDAGGGHRSAANSLRAAIELGGYNWDLRDVNLQEVLDPMDIVRIITGMRAQDIYNKMLTKGWTGATAQLNSVLHAAIRFSHKRAVDLLERFWRDSRPEMVVSLVPHFNRQLQEALHRVSKAAEFVTVMTDIADYPPHFWIERQDQFLICGSEHAWYQARELGFPGHLG